LEIANGVESVSEALYEVGKLYCERGDFYLAASKLKAASLYFEENHLYKMYLKCTNLLLRVYAETEDHRSIESTKEKLHELVVANELELTSKTYYTFALCASYKGQQKVALEYLEKALATALSKDDKEDVCFAIYGLAAVYFHLQRYEDALREIYNLQVFFQVLDLPEIRLTSQILNGHILRACGQPARALELFLQSYDNLKEQKNMYIFVTLLFALGITYKDLGDKSQSRFYLQLAKRSADPQNLRIVYRAIEAELKQVEATDEPQFDLIFDSTSNSVVERKMGRIDFKNQFILLDLLQLFVKNPGEVHTKENLVKRIWKENYDPSVHDNKIYVTIKRLRKLIEPDFEKPRYIFRAKNGYYLNRNARVLMGRPAGLLS
jgi:tetratricopeptide (TPR) repeat protein